jgi:transposase-like protein
MYERILSEKSDEVVSRYKCRKCGNTRVEVFDEYNRQKNAIASKMTTVLCLRCGRKRMIGVPTAVAYRMSHKIRRTGAPS